MRIAIVGTTGLIGSALARARRARGDDVIGVVRSRSRTPPDWSEVVWDASSGPAPAGVFEGCSAVVNLAGAPIAQRWTEAAWERIVASRVIATEHVAGAVDRDGVDVLANGSAVGYYGATDEQVDEGAGPGSGPLADLCERWEAAARTDRARVVHLRSGVVLSAHGGALARMLTPAKLGLGGPIGGGRQWLPWIHIADEVGLIQWALESGFAGPLNLVAPGIVRQREFAATLGSVLGRPAALPTPTFMLRLMLGEGATVVTEGQRVLPAAAERGGYAFRFPTLDGALRDLVG